MKINWHNPELDVPVAVVLFIIGIIITLLTFGTITNGALIPWQSVGLPPGGAKQFVAIDYLKNIVVVRGKSSTTSFYQHVYDRKGNWEETSKPSGPLENNCVEFMESRSEFKRLPGKTMDCLDYSVPIGEQLDTTTFVILEDGSVWKWHQPPTNPFHLLALIVCPTPLVLLIGWTTFRIKRRKPKPSSEVDSPPVSENSGNPTDIQINS
jgi:hypothetical protein